MWMFIEEEQMAYFPLYIDIRDLKILMVGGGVIACRRLNTLRMFHDHITVISPFVCKEIEDMAADGFIQWIQKNYTWGDLQGYNMVLAATDDRTVNHEVFLEAGEEKIPVNISDCKEECSFYFPSIIKEEDMVIGVTSGGTDHKRTKQTADRIRSMIWNQKN